MSVAEGIAGTVSTLRTMRADYLKQIVEHYIANTVPSAHTLGSHSDVTLTALANGDILKYNGSKWVNNTLAQAGIATPADITTAIDAIKPWRIYDSVATKPNTDNDIFAYVLEPNIMTNKLWFYDIGLFLFEGSNDGVSFSVINVSTNDLKKVLSNYNAEAVALSLPSYRHFRITITGDGNRVALTALQMKMITLSKAVNILIESHRNTDSNWHSVVNTVWAGGYPDTMTLRHDSFQFHPTWTGGNGSDKARITISYADGSANALRINSLR